MLFPPAIQFYVDNILLTLEEAAQLDAEELNDLELQVISTPFFRQLLAKQTYRVKLCQYYFSRPEILNGFCEIQNMIDNEIITLDKALQSFYKGYLIFPVFRSLLISNYSSIDVLSAMKPAIFENIQVLLNRKIVTEEDLFQMTKQQIEDIGHFGGLVVNGFCKVDTLLLLTSEQSQNMHDIRKIAAKSGLNIVNSEPGKSFFQSTNGQKIADTMCELIVNQQLTLDVIFNMPPLGIVSEYMDNRLCTLITHGRMGIQQLLSADQYEKLQYNGVYQLILNGTLSLDQLCELTMWQCFQLEEPMMRVQIESGCLSLDNISQAENYSRFYFDTPSIGLFFNPGPKHIPAVNISNKRKVSISTEVEPERSVLS